MIHGQKLRTAKSLDPETTPLHRWAKHSAVKRDDGTPLRVYHGTRHEARFKDGTQGFAPSLGVRRPENDEGWLGMGTYFTDSRAEGNQYATGVDGARVYQAYLDIRNPWRPDKATKAEKEAVSEAYSEHLERIRRTEPYYDAFQARSIAKTWALQSLGYDGIIAPSTLGTPGASEYVIFESVQAKSATGNSGAFDPDSADIADEGAAVPPSQAPTGFDLQPENLDAMRRVESDLPSLRDRLKEAQAAGEQLTPEQVEFLRALERQPKEGPLASIAELLQGGEAEAIDQLAQGTANTEAEIEEARQTISQRVAAGDTDSLRVRHSATGTQGTARAPATSEDGSPAAWVEWDADPETGEAPPAGRQALSTLDLDFLSGDSGPVEAGEPTPRDGAGGSATATDSPASTPVAPAPEPTEEEVAAEKQARIAALEEKAKAEGTLDEEGRIPEVELSSEEQAERQAATEERKQAEARSQRAKEAGRAGQRKRKASAPDLHTWLRRRGGLRFEQDFEGIYDTEQEARRAGTRLPPGETFVIQERDSGRGMPLDEAIEAAIADGFFPGAESGSFDPQEFRDALEENRPHPEVLDRRAAQAAEEAEAEREQVEDEEIAEWRAEILEQGYSPEEADNLIAEALANPKPAEPLGYTTFLSGILPFQIPKGVTNFFRRNLRSRGALPSSTHARNQSRKGEIGARLELARNTANDFQRLARKHYGKKISEKQRAQIDNALKGSRSAQEALPRDLRRMVRSMRNQIDALSRELIAEGVIQGPLRARVEENLGTYATRTFKAFTEPNWAENVPAEIRNRMRHWLRTELESNGHDPSTLDIEAEMDAILYGAKDSGSPLAWLAGGKLGSKNLNILKARKKLPRELREFLGENRDALVNFNESMGKMSALLANHRFLHRVAKDGLGHFLFTRPKGEAIGQIAADSSSIMAPLNGLYAEPELIRAFEEFEAAAPPTDLFVSTILKVNGFAKVSKTILSPMTQARNVSGNLGFMVANGHYFSARAVRNAAAGTAASGGKGMDALMEKAGGNLKKWRAYRQRAIRLGVIGESVHAGELKDIARDMDLRGPLDFLGKDIKEKLRMPLSVAEGLYAAGDDVFKLVAWENEIARYTKAYEKAGIEKSPQEIEAMTADIVRRTYPTYSDVPPGVKKLRRNIFIGTFTSFPAEVVRVAKNTTEIMWGELNDPALRGIGLRRMVGMSAAISLPAAAATMLRAYHGISDEDDEDFREFVPPWSKNGNLLHFGINEDGTRSYLDFSYIDPYSYLKDGVSALWRGEGPIEGPAALLKHLAEPFLSWEMMSMRAGEVVLNKKETGPPVYNEASGGEQIAQDIANHLWEGVEPGAISSVRKVMKGLDGEVETWGKAWDAETEAIAMMTGIRVSRLDMGIALQFKASEYQSMVSGASSHLSSTLSSGSRTVSEAEIRDAYEQLENTRESAFEQVQKSIRAARNMGTSEAELAASLETKIAKEWVRGLLQENYTPYRPSSSFMRGAMKTAKTNERRDELRRRLEVLKRISAERRSPDAD